MCYMDMINEDKRQSSHLSLKSCVARFGGKFHKRKKDRKRRKKR
jgi:hypothetical protein